jgi:uncharacterized protein (DUF58 family)
MRIASSPVFSNWCRSLETGRTSHRSDHPMTDRAPRSTVFNPALEPLRGARLELPELTAARLSATGLVPHLRQRTLGQLLGDVRSSLRGRGLEFEEVRGYQAGDDVRNIDWRVTARAGRPFTKLFREERERPLLLVIDQRQPMFFGSRTCFKAKLAGYLGALLAWAGLQQGDRIGGLIIGNDGHHEIRPRRSRKTALLWLNALHDFNQRLRRDTRLAGAGDATAASAASLVAALADLRRIARPGSAIFIISDFAGAEDPQVRELLHNLARHCEITAIHVFDPLERELPPPALYMVTDGERRAVLDSGASALRDKHRADFDRRHAALRQLLAGMGIPLVDAATDQPPLAIFRQQRPPRSRGGVR